MAQLKSTSITGNLAVTNSVVATKFIKLGGTDSEFLMADGSAKTLPNASKTVFGCVKVWVDSSTPTVLNISTT